MPKYFNVKIVSIEDVPVYYLDVCANVRHWEDATVNGVLDSSGELIPCREGDAWKPRIELETGRILNWKYGVTAKVHYKVCDDGFYTLIGVNNKIVKILCDYVPKILCPNKDGYGDYIIMNIDENGIIEGFNTKYLSDFNDKIDGGDLY